MEMYLHRMKELCFPITLEELKTGDVGLCGNCSLNQAVGAAHARLRNLRREINEYYWNAKVDVPLLELRNLFVWPELIVRSALQRKESRGLHFTLDYPDQSAKPKNTRVATRA